MVFPYQVVWKGSSEIGAAQAVRKDGKLVVVVRYNPVGNINSANAFRRNVLPALKTASKSNGKTSNAPGVFLVLFVTATTTFSVYY